MQLPVVDTVRLRLRRFTPDDVSAVHAYTHDAHVMEYMPPHSMSWAQTQAFVTTQQGADAQAVAIVHRATDAMIGHLVFHAWVAPRTYEIGWVIHPDHQHRGYASEAASAALAYAFAILDAHRVIATCQPENPASYRVMEKIGMRREAHFRQCISRGGDMWWDEYFYAILATEWRVQS